MTSQSQYSAVNAPHLRQATQQQRLKEKQQRQSSNGKIRNSAGLSDLPPQHRATVLSRLRVGLLAYRSKARIEARAWRRYKLRQAFHAELLGVRLWYWWLISAVVLYILWMAGR